MTPLSSLLSRSCLFVCVVGSSSVSASTAVPLAERTPDGFLVPRPGYEFSFPADHGSHPGFKIEWWYLTGNLHATAGGPRFGYQATFFRQASPDGTTDIFLAHMAVVNTATGEFVHQERLNRPGWDAAAAVGHLDVRNGPWSIRMTDHATETMHLRGGVRAEALFDLTLVPAKPLVLFGDNGISRKGIGPTAASYYITFSRLNATGTLTWQGRDYTVAGLSWMDHEISSSQLEGDQIGWDWVSMHLTDGREVMLYRLRRPDGSADPVSKLTWVNAASRPQETPFTWEVLTTWTNPATGATYPARARITTTDPATNTTRVLIVEPLIAAQELTGELAGIPYWEGACRIFDETGREIGSAYMELTGYAKPLEL